MLERYKELVAVGFVLLLLAPLDTWSLVEESGPEREIGSFRWDAPTAPSATTTAAAAAWAPEMAGRLLLLRVSW